MSLSTNNRTNGVSNTRTIRYVPQGRMRWSWVVMLAALGAVGYLLMKPNDTTARMPQATPSVTPKPVVQAPVVPVVVEPEVPEVAPGAPVEPVLPSQPVTDQRRIEAPSPTRLIADSRGDLYAGIGEQFLLLDGKTMLVTSLGKFEVLDGMQDQVALGRHCFADRNYRIYMCR